MAGVQACFLKASLGVYPIFYPGAPQPCPVKAQCSAFMGADRLK